MNKLISVIIPHYNSLDSLLILLNTIPNDESIEVYVVDDHSRENIKDELNNKVNDNVNIIENTKKGAGSARNSALEKISGQWVVFADADDLFTVNAFDILRKKIKENSNSDVMFFTPTSRINNSSTTETAKRHERYEKLISNFIENNNSINEMKLRLFFQVPWSKLYNVKFIRENEIYFDDVMYSNDVMFSVKSGYLAEKITISTDVIYVVIEGDGSLTKNKNKNAFLCRYDVSERMDKFLKNHQLSRYRVSHLNYLMWSKSFGIYFMIKVFLDIFCKRKRLIPEKFRFLRFF